MELDAIAEVVSLVPENVRAAISALTSLGYRPQIPEPIERFADPAARAAWHRDRGMVALHLWHPADPKRHVDLFTHEPFDVDDETGDPPSER